MFSCLPYTAVAAQQADNTRSDLTLYMYKTGVGGILVKWNFEWSYHSTYNAVMSRKFVVMKIGFPDLVLNVIDSRLQIQSWWYHTFQKLHMRQFIKSVHVRALCSCTCMVLQFSNGLKTILWSRYIMHKLLMLWICCTENTYTRQWKRDDLLELVHLQMKYFTNLHIT